jgi:hypothetical protein
VTKITGIRAGLGDNSIRCERHIEANQGNTSMRKLIIITAVAASALIAAFSATSAIAVSGQSQSAAPTISDLHQPVRIGEAGQVLRRMP